jgi:hypothetical protein
VAPIPSKTVYPVFVESSFYGVEVMTTPMTRDELVELMARDMEKTLAYEVERDVLACDLTREEQRKVASAALRALEAANCQIVQGEPVSCAVCGNPNPSHFDHGAPFTENYHAFEPLYAGKVQP